MLFVSAARGESVVGEVSSTGGGSVRQQAKTLPDSDSGGRRVSLQNDCLRSRIRRITMSVDCAQLRPRAVPGSRVTAGSCCKSFIFKGLRLSPGHFDERWGEFWNVGDPVLAEPARTAGLDPVMRNDRRESDGEKRDPSTFGLRLLVATKNLHQLCLVLES